MKIVYKTQCVVIICKILFEFSYVEIKKKLEMKKKKTIQSFIKRTVNRTKCTNIFEILTCVRIMNRLNALQRMKNNFKISADMRKAILKYFDIKCNEGLTMLHQDVVSINLLLIFCNKDKKSNILMLTEFY